MAHRPLSIALQALPHRPRPLSDSALSQVFGGCAGDQGDCKADKDCCDGFHCLTSSYFVCVSDTQGQPIS
jgi:hypothetical protein